MLGRKGQVSHTEFENENKITLHKAAFNGDIDTVKKLLDQGVDLNEINQHAGTPLLCATFGKKSEIVKILLEHKANPSHFSFLLEGIAPLLVAAEEGNASIVKMLLEYHANPNQTDLKEGNSSLIYAARKGNTEIVKMLLEHKVNPNQANTNGRSPLIEAAFRGHDAIIKILVDHKVNLNQVDKNGDTPLIMAILQGCRRASSAPIVEMLLEQGANPNQVDQINPDNHPLLFLARQIHRNAKDAKYALKYKRQALLRTLFTRERRGGLFFNQEDKNMIHDEQVRVAAMVKMLLKHGANLNHTDEKGDTLEICAARDGNTDVVKVIKEQIEKQKAYEEGKKEIELTFKFFSEKRKHKEERPEVYLPQDLIDIIDDYFRPADIIAQTRTRKS